MLYFDVQIIYSIRVDVKHLNKLDYPVLKISILMSYICIHDKHHPTQNYRWRTYNNLVQKFI